MHVFTVNSFQLLRTAVRYGVCRSALGKIPLHGTQGQKATFMNIQKIPQN